MTTPRRRRPPIRATPPAPDRAVLTIPEAAYALHVHPNTIANLIRAGRLASLTLGRRRLVPRAAIDDLIAGGAG